MQCIACMIFATQTAYFSGDIMSIYPDNRKLLTELDGKLTIDGVVYFVYIERAFTTYCEPVEGEDSSAYYITLFATRNGRIDPTNYNLGVCWAIMDDFGNLVKQDNWDYGICRDFDIFAGAKCPQSSL